MDNNTSSSSKKITLDEFDGSGTTVLNVKSARQIQVGVTVDKSTHTHHHATTNPEGTGNKPIQTERSCCDKMNADSITSCDEFKKKLQQFYKQLTLPKVAWLDEGEDLSIVDHFVQLELTDSEKPIAFEEIFQPVEETQPTRILIEGQPGFGKTTLATKLAHDWAIGKSYVNFNFVFFVPLRELRDRSLGDAIAQIGKRCNFHNNAQIFNRHMKSTLLILDGLDEVPQHRRREVYRILYKQMYSDVTVIVFCRAGTFALSREERKQLFGLDNRREQFHDKQITTLGVTNDHNKRLFLEKFVPKSRVDNVMKHLVPHSDSASKDECSSFSSEDEYNNASSKDEYNSSSPIPKLFDSPLLLMLLSVLIQLDETIEEIGTRTQFYKQLFNCVLKHSYAKREHKISSDFDLFHLESSPNAIQQTMRQFGKLSMQNVLDYNLQFESNDSTDEIYELGFLLKHRERTFVSSKNHYEGLHLSIIEFAAAFGFWLELKLKNFALVQNDLKRIVNHFFKTRGTSLVLPFLVTLMEDELDVLLSLIESISGWFSLHFVLTVDLFSECQSNYIAKSTQLRNFIPQHIDLRDHGRYKNNELELLTYGSECGQIKKIVIDGQTDLKILTTKIASCCEIKIEIDLQNESRISFSLYTNICYLKTIPYSRNLTKSLFFLHHTASSNYEIRCNMHCSGEWLDLMTEENMLKKIKFRYLATHIGSELKRNVVIQLLENDQVAHLKLHTRFPFNMSDFCCAAAKSKQLTHLELHNFNIDFYDLTAGGTKKYTLISLHQCALTCRRSLLVKNCCQHLRIADIRNVEAIADMEPSVFTYTNIDKEIEDLIAKYPISQNRTDIKTVILIPDLHCSPDLNSAWKNMHTLIISNLIKCDQEKLSICIHNLPIINLVIKYISAYNRSYGANDFSLFEHMNNLWAANNNSRLSTILLIDSKVDKSSLKDVIKGLECNHWHKVHFNYAVSYNNFRDLEAYLLLSNLRITHATPDSICAELNILSPFEYSVKMLSISLQD